MLGNFGFIPPDDAGIDGLTRLDAVFQKFGAGIKTNRDAVVINFDDMSLLAAVEHFNARG